MMTHVKTERKKDENKMILFVHIVCAWANVRRRHENAEVAVCIDDGVEGVLWRPLETAGERRQGSRGEGRGGSRDDGGREAEKGLAAWRKGSTEAVEGVSRAREAVKGCDVEKKTARRGTWWRVGHSVWWRKGSDRAMWWREISGGRNSVVEGE